MDDRWNWRDQIPFASKSTIALSFVRFPMEYLLASPIKGAFGKNFFRFESESSCQCEEVQPPFALTASFAGQKPNDELEFSLQ